LSAEILFDNFDLLADASNSAYNLRELIVQLAMRGKLVSQNPSDQPASELLESIKRDSIAMIETVEMPFELPIGWVWIRLGDVLSLEYGDNLPASKRDDQGRYPVYGSNGIVGHHDQYLIKEPAIIVGRKGSCGALNLTTGPSWPTDVCYYVIPPIGLDLSFAFLLLESLHLDELGKGIKPGLNRNEAYKSVAALPPTDEQRRIVAKVHELMSFCDELEKKRVKRNEARIRLNVSALDHLLAAKDPKEFDTHWQRITTDFDLLYEKPETVGKLRQAIVQLGMQGKLVPQDPKDEPATLLLEEIKAEKERLIKEKKIKKSEMLQSIADGEMPYKLPKEWVWCRLGECALDVSTGPFGTMLHKSDYIDNGIPLVNPVNMVDGRIVPSNKMMVSGVTKKRLESYVLSQGDIVLARRGEMGRCAVVSVREEGWLCGTGSFFVRLPQDIHGDFFVKFYRSKFAVDYLQKASIGATMDNLNHRILKKMLVPLPPLGEQMRISARIDQLNTMCNDLQAKLTYTEKVSEQLMEAVVRGVVAA
jgi:type I restriction enzyme, S subunit